MTFQEFCDKLEAKIIEGYTNGISMEDAEALAGEFLAAQMRISNELKKADLDARMRKNSVKAVRANAYQTAASKGDKKPTEAAIGATIDLDSEVREEQSMFDASEVEVANLTRLYNTFRDAHVFYRQISKGTLSGQ